MIPIATFMISAAMMVNAGLAQAQSTTGAERSAGKAAASQKGSSTAQPTGSGAAAGTIGSGASGEGTATGGSGGSAAAGGTSASTLGVGATSGDSRSLSTGGSAASEDGRATSRSRVNENPKMIQGHSRSQAQESGGTFSRSHTRTKVKDDEVYSKTRTMSREQGGGKPEMSTTETVVPAE